MPTTKSPSHLQAHTEQPTSDTRTARNGGYASIPTHEQIARRAYELYVESGCQPGRSEQHWFQAQRDLLAERLASLPEELPRDFDELEEDSHEPDHQAEPAPLRFPTLKWCGRAIESRQLMNPRWPETPGGGSKYAEKSRAGAGAAAITMGATA